MKNRRGRGAAALYILGTIGVVVVLVINSREQEISLFSWQNAALVGFAALSAVVSGLLVRVIRGRLRA